MKKAEVECGRRYVAKVAGRLVVVLIRAENPRGGWDAVSEKTGRPVRIKSAQRLRSRVEGRVVITGSGGVFQVRE